MTNTGVLRSLRRNALTLLNVAFMGPLFHDGRETSLETQVIAGEKNLEESFRDWLDTRP